MSLLRHKTPTPRRYTCLSRRPDIVSLLKELTPRELAEAANLIRKCFARWRFNEVLLSPLDAHAIDYENETLEVKGVGQLRFNTEPEIWSAGNGCKRFFSVSNLFRKEREINVLRRNSFLIVDFYQQGSPESILEVFFQLLRHIADTLGLQRLRNLEVEFASYNARTDAPNIRTFQNRWVITKGYSPSNSFFEVDRHGHSTRMELFLVTPQGYLEIGALGIVGTNRNPRYKLKSGPASIPVPPVGFSGMGIGLERLLLAERLIR